MTASMDIGVGGLLTTLSKMALINGVGFNIDLSRVPTDECGIDPTVLAFSETNARYVVEVRNKDIDKATSILTDLGVPFSVIGSSGGDYVVVRWGGGRELMTLKLNDLKTAYNSLWGGAL